MVTPRNLLTQISVVVGGAVGLGAEWLCRPESDRRLFLAAFTAAWLAMGMVTLVTGEVALEPRSAPKKEWHGMPARVLGALMSLAAVVMYAGVSGLRSS